MKRTHEIVRKSAGALGLLLVVPVLSLCATPAAGQTTPIVVMSQVTKLGTLPNGGALSGGNPAGGGVAIDSAGNLYATNTYGNTIVEFAAGSTTATSLGTFSNPGPVAIDPAGNLYIGQGYNGTVIKIPLVNGIFAAISTPTSSTPPCTGSDTAECALPFSAPIGGVVAMTFDAAGDLFFTSTNAGTDPNSVFECTAACVQSGTPAPVLLYAEPSGTVAEGTDTATWQLGGIAIDLWGDVFFADSLLDNKDQHGFNYQSTVKELTYASGSYSSTPVVLYTLNDGSPADYDDEVTGVATDANGTLYYTALYDGIFALPNNKGAVTTTTSYMVSPQGAKIMNTDGRGNFYIITNTSSGDGAMHIGVGLVTAPASSVGSSTTASATVVLNDEGCSPTPTVNFSAVQGGTTSTEFSAATNGSCTTVNGSGASYPVTVTFTPSYGGNRSATLTATEASGPGSSGTATVSGFATGQLPAPSFSPAPGTYTSAQSVALSDSSSGALIYFTTDGSTPSTSSTLYSSPISVSSSQTINAIATSTTSGLTASPVGTGAYTINYPAAAPTISPVGGSYSTAQTVTISDTTAGAAIYYTTNGTTPTASSIPYSGPLTVSASTVLKAVAVANGATSNVAAATYAINSATGGTSLSVLTNQTSTLGTYQGGGALASEGPAGNSFAVDANGNLILSTTYGNDILEFPQGATTGTVLASGFSNIGSVALDAAGNLYISFLPGSTPNNTIAKIPLVGGTFAAISQPGSGTPACTGSDTAECVLKNMPQVPGIVSMAFDSAGDLFFNTAAGTTNPNTIYECTAACAATGSPAPVALYAEPTATVAEGSANASWYLGGIAVDPWGDVFFTDTLMVASANTNYESALKELTYSGGAYSTTPTTLYTETDSSPSAYDNQLDAVAVDGNGTVYFADQYSGVFAFANNNGTVNTTTEYTVSTQGAKIITLDAKANVYLATYSGSASSDVAMEVAVNNITLPNAAVAGSATATNVTTILNDGGCSTSPAVSFSVAENGASSNEFLANTTGSCSGTPTGGSSFATNVTFNPATGGTHVGQLTAVDTVNGGVGVANLYGVTSGNAASIPTFSPAAGTYTSIQTVTISDTTPAATIYYTTDGTAPTTSSAKYTAGITVSASETVNAIAVASGIGDSGIGSAIYTLNLPVTTTPTISVATGTYTSIQTVKITDGTLGAKIYYTTDGSTPTTSSTKYTSPITVSTSETLNAIAVASGYSPSTVATATYTVNLTAAQPTFSPAGGTFTTIQTVTLADTTPSSSIYYTTDGSTPTTSSTLYSGPIQVLGSETINAIGAASGYANSPVATATYTLNLPQAATPSISLGTGTYTVAQPVTITDATTGATIYYTLDGSTPTTSSKVYSAALTLSASETLKAMAVGVGYSPSAVATSSYTVNIMPSGIALSVNPSSLTIPSTSTFGTIQLTVQPQGGFTGAVQLSCSGLPAGASCGFSASPVNVNNFNQPQIITVTIGTGQAQSAMLRYRSNPLLPGATLAVALCFLGFRKRRGIQVLLLAVISVLGVSMLAGCGSSGPGTTTSTATITATAGSVTAKTTVSVTMNH